MTARPLGRNPPHAAFLISPETGIILGISVRFASLTTPYTNVERLIRPVALIRVSSLIRVNV
ncbi:protein of unknown function [Methylocaldum szegediense]|uniref:Uncharacterized protein n=1 Tax=Methylocaldum szegediense TaxID=73780 RepID=A0ABM9I2T0_9GAMM|nr:protein of unknown function [Methylocaldum szegediense]